MAFGSTLRAPHGGIWVLGLIGNPVGFLVAILAGSLATTGVVLAAKQIRRAAPTTASTEQPVAA